MGQRQGQGQGQRRVRARARGRSTVRGRGRVRGGVRGEEQWQACSCEHKGHAIPVAVSLTRQERAALWPLSSTSGKSVRCTENLSGRVSSFSYF